MRILHDWISMAFLIFGMITYYANVKWLSPVTWSLYGLYFISTVVIINSRRKEMGSIKLALKKTICDICIVLSPVVLYVVWLIKYLI